MNLLFLVFQGSMAWADYAELSGMHWPRHMRPYLSVRHSSRLPKFQLLTLTAIAPAAPTHIRFHSVMDAVVHPEPSTLRITTHTQYESATTLTPSSVCPSPLAQFDDWFMAASAADVTEPEAASLSTCTPAGIPSSRIVLLKQVDARGFVFFTNYASRKSRELADNPHAALVFYWRQVSRQVRVVGRVEKVSKEESEAYFRSRPVGSRVGAWASRQSSVVREGEVAECVKEIENRFGVEPGISGADIPLPEFWGGWRVIPDEVEFWAGKPSRLHDRVRYLRVEPSSKDTPEWKIERLAP